MFKAVSHWLDDRDRAPPRSAFEVPGRRDAQSAQTQPSGRGLALSLLSRQPHLARGAPLARLPIPNRKSELDLTEGNTRPIRRQYLRAVGPGLTTGASDDDPSGIATYSRLGLNTASRFFGSPY
jgi:hypothetical protein